jgi:two-component system cell cycle response regulator
MPPESAPHEPTATRTWRTPTVGYLAAVAVTAVLYYLFALAGAAGAVLQVVTYGLVMWSAVGAIVVGVRLHHPANRRVWLLLAAGQLFTAIGEVVFDVSHQLLGSTADISAADVFYLSAYPLLAAALLLMVRYRTPGWDAPSIIDAGIVTISAALLSWMFLISPTAFAADMSVPARLVSAGYPLMDLLLLAVAARLLLGAGSRTTSFRLLTAGLVLLLIADAGYGVQNLLGTYRDGNFLDAGWMFAAGLIGAAGLHPSMSRVTEVSPAAGPDATPGRLAVLAMAALLAPAALLVQYLRHSDMYVPIATGSCMALFLLVIARMAVMVRAQREMAITDALTGLRTRRFLEQALDTEAPRANRHEASIGLLLLDVDYFKQVNDGHGHHGGDRVLCEVARRLGELVRPGDVVARYGGEEFAVLLPQASGDDVIAVGERIRRGVASTPFAVDRDTLITVTVSIGAAALPEHVDTITDLTLTADRALYAAKESGRNRLVTAQASPRH